MMVAVVFHFSIYSGIHCILISKMPSIDTKKQCSMNPASILFSLFSILDNS